MSESHAAEIIRRYYAAYESKDKEALEGLLSDGFMFSSPHDDRINQQTYFAKCWPFSEKVRAFHLERIAEDGDKVFVLYECEPANGVTFRNVEVFRIEHGKVKEVVVYFGRKTRDALAESEAEEIRRLVDKRLEAICAKDVDGATSMAALDYVLFDVVEPLRSTGANASKRRAEEWFSTFQGPIGYEIRDLQITAAGGVGFSHGLNHVSATKTDGNRLDMWWRATVCYRKMDGRWRITHEHNSVPFDVTNGKASLGLEP
jgi:ketosteroid isomerase-like protein